MAIRHNRITAVNRGNDLYDGGYGKCCTYDNEWLGSEGVMREMNQSVYKEYHGASMIPRAVYVIT